jgi:quercetin dioxygenase-like cupin family protein
MARATHQIAPAPALALVFLTLLNPTVIRAQNVECVPVSQRAGQTLGCFITAREELGVLPKDSALFWQIDSYSASPAAEASKGARSTVVESLGQVWLFSIAPATWRSAGGTHVATIGPLPLVDATAYAAVYMEGVFEPGMHSRVHRHPGMEAWYTLEGEQCVETPNGKIVQRAGDPGMIVPGGDPMQLTGSGTGVRRSLVLILQDSAKARSSLATDWVPKGLCSH